MTRFPTPPARESKSAERVATRWADDLPAAFSAEDLRAFARKCPDVRMRGHLLMIASIYDGMTADDAARIWRVNKPILEQVLRRFIEDGIEAFSFQPRGAENTPPLGDPGP